jgi:glycosyltransferase involved in cell wall biosynthesis
VNALFLEPRMGGIETFVRRLLPAMAELRPELRISVFVNERGRALLGSEPWADAVELVDGRALGRRGTRAVTEALVLGALADQRAADVIYSVAMTGPLRSRAARVVVVPDVIWMTHPDPEERHTARLWRVLVPRVARRADRVITLSEASRRDLTRLLGLEPGRIDVVPLGRDEPSTAGTPAAELRERLGLGDGPILLAVSAAKAHKNLPRLVEALARIAPTHADATLVVPGNPTALRGAVERRADELGLAANVRFPGWVDDADLEGLYRACACVVIPSLAEGFGLPVLEAMVHGAPVACSRASSLPEVGGTAVAYFDPLQPDDIAAAVRRVLEDTQLAGRLREAGLARSNEFSWRRTAELTLASCERAAAGR